MKTKEIFISDLSIANDFIKKHEYPYQVLKNIHDYIIELGNSLSEDYIKTEDNIWIHKDAKVNKTAEIHGPCIIDANAEIRCNAFIRGNVIIGKNTVFGNSCEIKNSILYDNVQVPHFSYIGDSILGYSSHMGASSITSNLKSDKTNITIKENEDKYETGLRKIGAFLGDGVEIGSGCILNPGTIIKPNTSVYPLTSVRGVIPANAIVKSMDNIVIKEVKKNKTKLFGTDGVRGIVSTELDATLAYRIGASTVRVIKEGNKELTFLIAADTRKSKDMLKHALAAGVLSENANIIDLGVIPTPAISYLIKKYNADGGFVISASHNPSEYNGIKVFNKEGYKLADELESKIEDIILNNFKETKETNKVGTYRLESNAQTDYVNYLASTINTDLSNLRIAIDAANGAAYQTAKMLFDKIGINYVIINDKPNGLNINDNAGSTHIETLQKFVSENHFDCGIAFDGDADRCLMVDELGNLVDGDKILAIYANYLKEQNKLKNNTLVGTVMSNLGLVKYCKNNDINFIATKVGDRYVLEEMLLNDYVIGGEQSGHIIFKEFANTGDGELTALQILNIMAIKNKKLSTLASIMDTYPQVLKNVEVTKEMKETYQKNVKINEIIEKVKTTLANDGRVLVRASGTENIIRVMLEGKDLNIIEKLADEIVEVVKEKTEQKVKIKK